MQRSVHDEEPTVAFFVDHGLDPTVPGLYHGTQSSSVGNTKTGSWSRSSSTTDSTAR